MLLSDDREQLNDWRNAIITFLNKRLKLELNHQKTIFKNIDRGIDWLGYIVKPSHVLVRRRIVKNFKRKLFQYNQILENYFCKKDPSLELIEKMLAASNSYFGHFKHADTFKLRTHLWEKHFQNLNKYIEPKDPGLASLQIKPEFLERAGRAR